MECNKLMIVVAIIGILAAIAIPAYQNYTKRAHVSEGLSLAGSAKTGVTEFYASQGHFPTGTNPNNSAGLADSTNIKGNAVTSVGVTTATGLITITYNDKVTSGATLTLSPTVVAGAVTWKCKVPTSGGVDSKYLPSNCR